MSTTIAGTEGRHHCDLVEVIEEPRLARECKEQACVS
jgi:hypothetical protein